MKTVYCTAVRLPRPIAVAVVAFFLLALIPGLGRQGMERQQELRVALAARHMAEGGSWLVPRFEGEVRLQKPPLMYWIVATTYKLAGTTRSAFVARLPNAAFSLLLLWAMYAGGTVLVGRPAARTAAIVAFSSFLFQRHARLAEADMALTLFTMLAVVCAWLALHRERAAWWWLGAGLCSGLGFMVKGPGACAIPVLAVVSFAACTKGPRRSLLSWKPLLAVAACALLASSWYVALQLRPTVHAAVEQAAEGELAALIETGDHPGPVYYYLYRLPVVLLPWGVLLPLALIGIWQWKRREEGPRLLLTWLGTAFLLLSALHQKQQQYALLLVPPAALLIGLWLVDVAKRVPWWQRNLDRLAVGILVVIAAGTQAYVFFLHPAHRPESLMPQFAECAQPWLAPAERVYFTGTKPNSFEFYGGRTHHRAPDLPTAWSASRPGDVVVAVYGGDHHPEPESLPAEPALDMRRGEMRFLLWVKE
ncbi:MAG: glycosyltransferase family 39 protein [Kiritimatiellae bacterium]|nr:glycosyltransferase family 39 protein [Kiritimatiellia bacterium]